MSSLTPLLYMLIVRGGVCTQCAVCTDVCTASFLCSHSLGALLSALPGQNGYKAELITLGIKLSSLLNDLCEIEARAKSDGVQ